MSKMKEPADDAQRLNQACEDIARLQLRVRELEIGQLGVDELKEKVARLERLQVQRQSIELAGPGEPINRLKRSKS